MARLINELVKRGLLDKTKGAEFDMEIERLKKREEEFILEKNIVTEELLFSIKSELLKIPFRKVDPDEIDPKVLELIPEDTASYYHMVPISRSKNYLEVGMVYPEEIESQDALRFAARKANLRHKVFLISLSNFKEILKKYRTVTKEVKEILEKVEKEIKIEEKPIVAPEKITEEAPVVKAIGTILRYGIEGSASDIHIEPVGQKSRVRFRILGTLFSSLFFPIKIHPALVARVKILADLRLDETRIPQDGRFSEFFEGRKIDFRVSTFPTAQGEKVAIRILDPLVGLKKVEELGLKGRNLEIFEKAIKKPYGMILVTGPTGSGKSTTLYAILQKINKEEVNIVTLEDPVEYLIEGINQSQVNPDIGYDFARGLRHVLRQDPDIILVGEIRDQETAFLATHAALTGHLVLSTLHTNDAIGVIPRLIDMGVERFLIPSTLNLAVSQRLVKRLCPQCRIKKKPSPEILRIILQELESLPKALKNELKISENEIFIYEPKGCKNCDFKGFVGRMGLFEILEMDDKLADVILKEPTEANITDVAKNQGMITMKQDGILKVIEGETSLEEVLRETGE